MSTSQRWIPGIIGGLIAGALVGYLFGLRHPASNAPAAPGASTSPAAAHVDAKTGRKVLYWHDPMKPGQRFDKPGKSPFMDMDLVPVYGDSAAPGEVTISPQIAQNLGMRTATARRADVTSSVEATGTFAVDERSIQVLQSRVNGYVENLRVRANLDTVVAGQPVATVFAPEWASPQDEYLALRRLHADPALVEAARQRLALLSIPEEVIRAAEAADRPQLRHTLRAPASGIVSELSMRDGAMVTPGMTLMRIVDLRHVWLHVEVPEAAAALIAVGHPVTVRAAGFPDRALAGRIAAVLPEVSAETRTLRVRVELSNPGQSLKPGMIATVTLTPPAAQGVVVPQAAVIPTGRRTVVILKQESGGYRPVEVETGRSLGDDIEIRKGLEPGQTVVVSGQFLLDSEASLKAGLPRLDTAPKTPAPPDKHAAAPEHHGEGTVEAIGQAEITLDHGPIASLQWPGMSMPFSVRKGALPAGLKVGDRVAFTLIETSSGDMEISRLERLPAGGKSR